MPGSREGGEWDGIGRGRCIDRLRTLWARPDPNAPMYMSREEDEEEEEDARKREI